METYFINKIINGVETPTLVNVDVKHPFWLKELNDEVIFEDGNKGYILFIFKYNTRRNS